MRRIAVVGSRTFSDYELFYKTMVDYIGSDEVTLVSGGASGADSFAQKFAKDKGLTITIHYPNWDKNGKSAGFIRNSKIVNDAHELVAFWDGKSKGTAHSIELASKGLLSIKIVEI